MTISTHTKVLVLALAIGGTGCDADSSPSPTTPSTVQAPLPQPVTTPTRAQFPPGVLSAYTLSGVVFEATSTGGTPIEGVAVYCELCGEETHSWSVTDSNGIYRFRGVWTTPGVHTPVWFGKEQYMDPPGAPRYFNESGYRQVLVEGDTRFDVELVRR
jgi:hypothetical protein